MYSTPPPQELSQLGIAVRVASPKLVMEEAPDSYKDVHQVPGLPRLGILTGIFI